MVEKEIVFSRECIYQQKRFSKDERYPDGGYHIYWCSLNTDPFSRHAVTGYDHEFCSSGRKD